MIENWEVYRKEKCQIVKILKRQMFPLGLTLQSKTREGTSLGEETFDILNILESEVDLSFSCLY